MGTFSTFSTISTYWTSDIFETLKKVAPPPPKAGVPLRLLPASGAALILSKVQLLDAALAAFV
jgi:hypothetical protein